MFRGDHQESNTTISSCNPSPRQHPHFPFTSSVSSEQCMYNLKFIGCQSLKRPYQYDENPAPRARQRIHGPNELREPTLPPFTISSSSDEDIHSIVASWRTCLRLFADTCAASSEMFTIHGDSLESVSHGFLLFLHHLSHITLSNHRAWELPRGISECGPPDFRSLLKQMIAFEV